MYKENLEFQFCLHFRYYSSVLEWTKVWMDRKENSVISLHLVTSPNPMRPVLETRFHLRRLLQSKMSSVNHRWLFGCLCECSISNGWTFERKLQSSNWSMESSVARCFSAWSQYRLFIIMSKMVECILEK